MQHQPAPANEGAAASASSPSPPGLGGGFELEEALYATAPVGLHCVDARGFILWANPTELNFLGYAKEEYVGQYASSFVYSDKVNVLAGSNGDEGNSQVNPLTADDKTLYNEVLKGVISGNPISEIPVRFVSRSGTVVHLLLDCDGTANFRHGTTDRYFRFFSRDDTARRIQEVRSNVLFQETNRSLQMLDNFMNRSMQQMRAPLTLMEKACNLVTENIEDIDEVVRRNIEASVLAANNQALQRAGSDTSMPRANSGMRRSSRSDLSGTGFMRSSRSNSSMQNAAFEVQKSEQEDGKPHALSLTRPPVAMPAAAAIMPDLSAPLSVALSATVEARSVVELASTLTKDALALVDDITDLSRFDQGRVLLIEKEAVKVRDICLEALMKVNIPVGAGGLVDVILDIQEGAPARTMSDRSVLQRSLTLLLNFAVDAAANAASTAGEDERGKVVLSVSDTPIPGGKSACRISVYYNNPHDNEGESMVAGGVMGSSALASGSSQVPAEFASKWKDHAMASNVGAANTNYGISPGMVRGNSFGKLPSIFGECYSKPNKEGDEALLLQQQQTYQTAHGGSMMRRVRLRESIEDGMTGCRRDKLGLGLSLLYHLVGAQGSDLRYEIVNESRSTAAAAAAASMPNLNRSSSVVLPSMTKFWFLLPMSLDFPDRLPAEQVGLDNLQTGPQTWRTSLLPPSFAALPDDAGLEGMPPPRKRARSSSQPVSTNPMNSVISRNVMGAMGDNSLFIPPESSASAASVPAPAALAPVESNASKDDNAATAASKPAAPTKRYPGVAPGARPLVLVVEDTDVSASLICMHLRKLNCTSHRAENGEVAIEMLRSAPSPNMYSLILMDLCMPVMDGFEATRTIKTSNARNVPVVALTGETSEATFKRCEEIGFDDYKTKPLKRPMLKELLNKLVPGYNG